MTYYSTKTYGAERGLSCCFRQWRAKHSHCSTLHGYAMGFKLTFKSNSLDERNWVLDFGGGALKEFEYWLKHTFDHKTLIARDDPFFQEFMRFSNLEEYDANGERIVSPSYHGENLRGHPMSIVVLDSVGCEAFAKLAFDEMERILSAADNPTGACVVRVEVFEHGSNSAIYSAGG